MTGELFSPAGRTAAVTGASRGIGLAVAGALAAAGADVIGIKVLVPTQRHLRTAGG